jgi:hypothetical protein
VGVVIQRRKASRRDVRILVNVEGFLEKHGWVSVCDFPFSNAGATEILQRRHRKVSGTSVT